MKIVIDIPEEVYKHLTEYQLLPSDFDADWAIIHGTPLPAGHGRLIDADELKIKMPTIEDEYKYAHELIDNAPTVIPADKSEVKNEVSD